MPAGRPKKELDKKDFESLLIIQCSLEEVTAFFDNKLDGCSEDTVERWCKRTYGEKFADVAAKKRALGKIGIRRAGYELAKKNAAVHIFYCKNYLGMTDKQEISSNIDIENLQPLAEMLKHDENADDTVETVRGET